MPEKGKRERKIALAPMKRNINGSKKEELSGAENGDMIYGRTPVLEAVRAGRNIDRIYVLDSAGGAVGKVISEAKQIGIPIRNVPKKNLDDMASGQNHQGIVALVSPFAYSDVNDVFARAELSGEPPFVVVLDGIEDPHNLGAIIRSAECAGAHGVIIPERGASGVTGVVMKTAAGACEYMPVVRVKNINRALEELKLKGLWIYAADMDGAVYYDVDVTGPCALVIGNEGRGISRLVRENSDFVISIPMKGAINSLNAAGAASVLMYEVRRQRETK